MKEKTLEDLLLDYEDKGIIVNYLDNPEGWHCSLNDNNLGMIHSRGHITPRQAVEDAIMQLKKKMAKMIIEG